jgi:hypothetical protein
MFGVHTPYYDGLVRLLNQTRYFGYRELGVPKRRKKDGDAPMEEILATLRTSDVVVVINTPVLANSPNVIAELEEAERCRIPIIAVTPKGRQPGRHAVLDRARTAAWRGDSIVTAIREEVKKARRLKSATGVAEVVPTEAEAFEPIEEAAIEAKANLTADELDQVRGEDEILVTSIQPTQAETPKDVLLRDRESRPTGPVPIKRFWLSKLWLRN